jgi:GntR family transcriptional regulator
VVLPAGCRIDIRPAEGLRAYRGDDHAEGRGADLKQRTQPKSPPENRHPRVSTKSGADPDLFLATDVQRRADQSVARHDVVDRLRALCLKLGATGSVVPSETHLATQFGVSRSTIREALKALETEGLLLRAKGMVTIVNSAALDMRARIDLQVDFAEILKDAGYAATVVVLEAGQSSLGPDDAAALGLPRGTPAFRTVKRWDANGEPAMVAVDWLPRPDGLDEIDPMRPVFEVAASIWGEPIGWEVVVPGAVAAQAHVAEWLQVRPGSALWTLDRVGMGRTGRRCYLALEYHLPSVIRYGFVRPLRRR